MDDDRDPLLGDAGDLPSGVGLDDLGEDVLDVLGDLDEENPDDFPVEDDTLLDG
ncbi:MAG: hypothetical protein WCW56_02055 [Candidatus Paceibacterota bacterium]|jgi:hypothetical protein